MPDYTTPVPKATFVADGEPLPVMLDAAAITRLDADQESDALIAVHVFGWRWMLDPSRNMIGLWPLKVAGWECWNLPSDAVPIVDPQPYQRYRDWHRLGSPVGKGHGLPAWSSTYGGMGEVITALRRRNLYWTGSEGFAPEQLAYAGFGAIAPSGHGWTHPDFQAVADSLALAMARAALLAARNGRHGELQITARREARHGRQ